MRGGSLESSASRAKRLNLDADGGEGLRRLVVIAPFAQKVIFVRCVTGVRRLTTSKSCVGAPANLNYVERIFQYAAVIITNCWVHDQDIARSH